MLNIAIVIVHNKTDVQNQAQIEDCKNFTQLRSELVTGVDDQGNSIGLVTIYHYEIPNLGVEHRVKLYQIVPFGVTVPVNLDSLDSHKVYYGKGDEDKTGEHPRFFNWGVKRGTDFGADICIYLHNPAQFNLGTLKSQINKLQTDTDFIDLPFAKISTLKALKEVGHLKEDRSLDQSLADFKNRVQARGLKSG